MNHKLTEIAVRAIVHNVHALVVIGLMLTVTTNSIGQDSAKEKLKVGIRVGPAIPGPGIAQVYNTLDTFGFGIAYESASSMGYTIMANGRIGMSPAFSLSGGIGFARFPNQELTMVEIANNTTHNLSSSTIIVPISAGISWLVIREGIVPVIHAEGLVSYRKTIVNGGSFLADLLLPGVELEQRVMRYGAQAGVTVELDLGIRPQLDITYAMTNLLGRPEGEASRDYLTVTVGIVF